jgi:hypothetical protein
VTKPITPRIHGILDYALVAVFLNAPMVFGFTGMPASVLYWLAGIHVLMTGFTDFPFGMFKVIPLRVHRAMDLLGGVFLIVAPWVLGFAGEADARNFFVVVGILGLAAVALTDYTPRVEVPPREPGDRREWRGPASTG